MNKSIATVGMILLLLAAFLFYVVFNGGSVGSFVITGGIPIFNYAAFVFVIVFLPVGSGLAFVGFSYRRSSSTLSAGSVGGAAGGSYASSAFAKAILAVAIVAVLVGAVTLAAVVSVDNSVSGISGKTAVSTVTVGGATSTVISTTTATKTVGGVSVNATPSTRFLRVDWCNTDNTGQDRFCPSQIVVNQGDIVVVLFEHNDTDAHTFTMLPAGTGGYDLQINATFGLPGLTKINGSSVSNGMHNFLTNTNFTTSCTNVGASGFSQQKAAISTNLCVSGASLLLGSLVGTVVFVNPTPGLPLNSSAPAGGLVAMNDTNSVTFIEPGGNMSIPYANALGLSCTVVACTNQETGVPAGASTWGIAAFQATSVGTFEFICHYHVSNGMFGYITVLPNAYCTSNPSGCGITNSTT